MQVEITTDFWLSVFRHVHTEEIWLWRTERIYQTIADQGKYLSASTASGHFTHYLAVKKQIQEIILQFLRLTEPVRVCVTENQVTQNQVVFNLSPFFDRSIGQRLIDKESDEVYIHGYYLQLGPGDEVIIQRTNGPGQRDLTGSTPMMTVMAHTTKGVYQDEFVKIERLPEEERKSWPDEDPITQQHALNSALHIEYQWKNFI